MRYLIANWKAELSFSQVKDWIATFGKMYSEHQRIQQAIQNKHLSLIICPSYPHITTVAHTLKPLNIEIGSQDISLHNKGKFTGEVTAQQLTDLITWSIIGHSERRNYEHETDDDVVAKIQQCTQHQIKSIQCIRGTEDTLFPDATLIAYEPTSAIGSGKNALPDEVVTMKRQLNLNTHIPFLYGGSVDPHNISEYLKTNEIDGFLVGTASLHPEEFIALIEELV